MKKILPVIRLTIISQFKKENLPLLLLSLLFICFYAYLGQQLATSLNSTGSPLTFTQAKLFLYLFLVLPVFAAFIPVIVPKRKWVPAYFPVNRMAWAAVDTLSALAGQGALSAISMIVAFLYAYQFKLPELTISLILLLVTGILASNVLMNIISWRKYQWLPVFIITMGLIVFALQWEEGNFPLLIGVAVAAILILFVLSILSFSLSHSRKVTIKLLSGKLVRYRSLLLLKETVHEGQAITPLLLGLLIKAGALFYFPIQNTGGSDFAMANVFHFFLFSPISVFLNVFNNAFGFFPGNYFLVYNYGHTYRNLLRVYFDAVAPLLLADLFISGVFYSTHFFIAKELGLFYLAVVPYYVAVGFCASLLFAQRVSAFSWGNLKGNTNMMANLVSALPVFAGLFLAKTVPLAYISALTLLISVLLYVYVLPVVFSKMGYGLLQKIKE